jgi:hypothetical protein
LANKKIYRRKATPKPNAPAPKKPFPRKKALVLLLSFLGFFTFYQVGVYCEWLWVLHAYAISAGVLALVYGFWNRGVFRIPTPEQLPDTWSKAEKEAFIEGIVSRRKRSSILLYFLIPLILSLVFDMFYLFLTLTLGMDL